MNVLFRQDPTARYTNVGAQGRRFFGTGEQLPSIFLLRRADISQRAAASRRWCRLSWIHAVSLFPFTSCAPLTVRSFRWTQAGHPAVQLDTAYSAFVRPGPLIVSGDHLKQSRSADSRKSSVRCSVSLAAEEAVVEVAAGASTTGVAEAGAEVVCKAAVEAVPPSLTRGRSSSSTRLSEWLSSRLPTGEFPLRVSFYPACSL